MPDHAMIADLHTVEMLQDLLSKGMFIMLSKDSEGEYFGDANKRMSSANTLEGCIEGLTGNPRMKVCLRTDCVSRGRLKLLSLFGPDKDSADGHAAVCRACEAKRIGERKKKVKDAKPEGPPNG